MRIFEIFSPLLWKIYSILEHFWNIFLLFKVLCHIYVPYTFMYIREGLLGTHASQVLSGWKTTWSCMEDWCYDCNTSTPDLWSQLQTSLPQLHCITNAVLHRLCIGIPSLVCYTYDHYPHPYSPYIESPSKLVPQPLLRSYPCC